MDESGAIVQEPGVPLLRPGRVFIAMMVLVHLSAYFIIPAGWAWPAEKMLALAAGCGALAGISLATGGGGAWWFSGYRRLCFICGIPLALLLSFAGQEMLDRKLDGWALYTLMQKRGLTEEMELIIYRNHLLGREQVSTEFFTDGLRGCSAYIGEGIYIETDCR